MTNGKFEFDKAITEALKDIESIPQTVPNAVPGIPGRLFIIAPEQKEQLAHIIKTLDNVSREEYQQMSEAEKLYYSKLLNNAEVVLKNSISRPSREDFLNQA